MSFQSFVNTIVPFFLLVDNVFCQTQAVANISSELTYLLPVNYQGNDYYNFVDTYVGTTPLFPGARSSFFVSYDEDFSDMLGPNPTAKIIAEGTDLAFEGGVWVPSTDEVWFTNSLEIASSTIRILDLATNKVRIAPLTGDPIVNPNGGNYFQGLVYFTSFGNKQYPGTISSIDPSTYNVTTVVNSYFGLRLNGPDDLVWTTSASDNNPGGANFLYFTDPNYSLLSPSLNSSAAQLPNNVWRFDPAAKTLLPVISRNDISTPNGIRVSPDMTTMYISDYPSYSADGGISGSTSGVCAIYAYDIDDDHRPVNRRLFGVSRSGGPDGMHVDDAGRLWTGEGEGVVVRSPEGKVIGVFNVEMFVDPTLLAQGTKIANFALAGDKVIILAVSRIWVVQLGAPIVSPTSFGKA